MNCLKVSAMNGQKKMMNNTEEIHISVYTHTGLIVILIICINNAVILITNCITKNTKSLIPYWLFFPAPAKSNLVMAVKLLDKPLLITCC